MMTEILPGRARRPLWGFAAIALCLAGAHPALAKQPESLRIFAAASTIGAVTKAVKLFKKATNIRVVPVFASSGALARQIDAGAPGHVFLSANRKWMDWLAQRGRITGKSRRVFLENGLVIAVPRESRLRLYLAPGFDLAGVLGTGRLAMADPAHVPLGAYGRAALKKLGAWDDIRDHVLRLGDAARARVMVERGEAAAGILYASDVHKNPRLRVAARFDAENHPPIGYELARIRNAGAPRSTRRFLKWLQGAAAARIFAGYGFRVKTAKIRVK